MAQKQKSNRKFGRNVKRPSCVAYKAGRRWAVNKDKRIAADAERKKDKADNPPKVAHGTARRIRRSKLNMAVAATIANQLGS